MKELQLDLFDDNDLWDLTPDEAFKRGLEISDKEFSTQGRPLARIIAEDSNWSCKAGQEWAQDRFMRYQHLFSEPILSTLSGKEHLYKALETWKNPDFLLQKLSNGTEHQIFVERAYYILKDKLKDMSALSSVIGREWISKLHESEQLMVLKGLTFMSMGAYCGEDFEYEIDIGLSEWGFDVMGEYAEAFDRYSRLQGKVNGEFWASIYSNSSDSKQNQLKGLSADEFNALEFVWDFMGQPDDYQFENFLVGITDLANFAKIKKVIDKVPAEYKKEWIGFAEIYGLERLARFPVEDFGLLVDSLQSEGEYAAMSNNEHDCTWASLKDGELTTSARNIALANRTLVRMDEEDQSNYIQLADIAREHDKFSEYVLLSPEEILLYAKMKEVDNKQIDFYKEFIQDLSGKTSTAWEGHKVSTELIMQSSWTDHSRNLYREVNPTVFAQLTPTGLERFLDFSQKWMQIFSVRDLKTLECSFTSYVNGDYRDIIEKERIVKMYSEIDVTGQVFWRKMFKRGFSHAKLSTISTEDFNKVAEAYQLANTSEHKALFVKNFRIVFDNDQIRPWADTILKSTKQDAIGGDTYERTSA